MEEIHSYSFIYNSYNLILTLLSGNHFFNGLHTSLTIIDIDIDNIVSNIKKEINRKRKIINIDDLRK